MNIFIIGFPYTSLAPLEERELETMPNQPMLIRRFVFPTRILAEIIAGRLRLAETIYIGDRTATLSLIGEEGVMFSPSPMPCRARERIVIRMRNADSEGDVKVTVSALGVTLTEAEVEELLTPRRDDLFAVVRPCGDPS